MHTFGQAVDSCVCMCMCVCVCVCVDGGVDGSGGP